VIGGLQKYRLKAGAACLIAGAVLPLAFAPFDIALLGVLAPAVLFYFLADAKPGDAFLYGYAFGLGMFGTGVNWLHISINLFGGISLSGAYLLTYLLVAYLALYPAFAGYLCRKYWRGSAAVLLVVALPAMWTLAEWCRSWFLTGFPWLNLGYSQTDTPLSGVSPLAGVYGASWLACLSAALLVCLLRRDVSRKFAVVLALVLVWAGGGILKAVPWTAHASRSLSVALIQGAIPQQIKWDPEQQQNTLELYLALSEPHWGKDLIIWPETAIPMLYHDAEPFIGMLDMLGKQHGTALLTGVPIKDRERIRYYNSLIMVGDGSGVYNKRHLVPFGEYLPLDKWLRPLLDYLRIPMSRFSAGAATQPLLRPGGVAAGVSICYEDVFGEEIITALPEAGMLINISNDAWFGDSIAPHQHLQMARMRALETGRYLLRGTNTGITAIIDEKGGVIGRSPQFAPYALAGDARVYTGTTPYVRFGNYPAVLLASALLLFCLPVIRRSDRARPAD